MISVDINCDMGEFPDPARLALQKELMAFVTSANIASGGHAGGGPTMQATIAQALRAKVAIGAHPGYPDPAHFGRLDMEVPESGIADFVARQVEALAEAAAAAGARVVHVKPHGALYNRAARDAAVARAILRGVAQLDRNLVLVALAGSVSLDIYREGGFAAAAEAFADRRYEPDGSLRSRRLAGALIEEPETAARQALELVGRDRAATICIHSDTPGALAMAQAVYRTLTGAGIALAPLRRVS